MFDGQMMERRGEQGDQQADAAFTAISQYVSDS
jgi:hypothetical protein